MHCCSTIGPGKCYLSLRPKCDRNLTGKMSTKFCLILPDETNNRIMSKNVGRVDRNSAKHFDGRISSKIRNRIEESTTSNKCLQIVIAVMKVFIKGLVL